MEIELVSPDPLPKSRRITTAMLAVFAAAIVFFILDLALKPQLQDSGAAFIEAIQTTRSGFGDVIFAVFSDMSLALILGIPALDYLLNDSQQGLKGIALALHVIYLTDILKMLYSDPRPYWKYSEVDGVKCSTGWGNPSGHASLSMAVLAYYSIIFAKQTMRPWASSGCCAVMVVLVGFDRLYLGVHFYSQLLLGWLLALSLTLVYVYIDPLLNKAYTATLYQRPSVLLWTVHAIVGIVVAFLVFGLRDPYWSPDWTNNIEADCESPITKSTTEQQSSVECTVICFVSGLAISLNAFNSICKNGWLKTESPKHACLKCGSVSCLLGATFIVWSVVIPVIPSAFGKICVSAVLAFAGGVLCNFGVVLASWCNMKASYAQCAAHELLQEDSKR